VLAVITVQGSKHCHLFAELYISVKCRRLSQSIQQA